MKEREGARDSKIKEERAKGFESRREEGGRKGKKEVGEKRKEE